MTTHHIPTGLDDLTPAWLEEVLAPRYGGAVRGLDVTPIGTGQIADSARLAIVWDPPDAGPASLVAKVTAASEASRAAAAATRTYEVEVGFYTTLAARLPVRTPRCDWAAHDPDAGTYTVLLEDVAPAEQGDQIAGCSIDEAAAALHELALLHGPMWGDTTLESLPWLHGAATSRGAGIAGALAMMQPGFLERYGDRLTPSVVELIGHFVMHADRYGADVSGPTTILHGDFRNDNLMFGGERVVVLDWQTVGLGNGLSDVSYFLGGSLLPEDRRASEEALVRAYVEEVRSFGVGLDWDACWTDYRRFAFSGLIMAIFASMLVGRTDRGDSMFVAMADRAGLHALDLDALSLIPSQNG